MQQTTSSQMLKSEPLALSQEPMRSGKKSVFRKMSMTTANFLGISETTKEDAAIWEHRRARIASSMGHGLNPHYRRSEASIVVSDAKSDQSRPPIYPLHISAADSMVDPRKKSVIELSVTAFRNTMHAQDAQRGKSVAFDKARASMAAAALAGKPTEPKKKSQSHPGTPTGKRKHRAPSPARHIDCSLSNLKEMLVDLVTKREKRQFGVGTMGGLLERKLRSSILQQVKEQIDNVDDHRPYFTYWVTTVQAAILFVALLAYGFAPVGLGTTDETLDVRMSNLAIQTEYHVERDNMWVGPRQADLVLLGAKYSACMRVDDSLNEALDYSRDVESGSACCIRKDGSGCVQTIKSGCDRIVSLWKKWTPDTPGAEGRTSGAVCGQDPRYCMNPSSSSPYDWPDEITRWPICISTIPVNYSLMNTKTRHMYCNILGKPCCFGIQGQCMITTKDHCTLLRGNFHGEANLCSQIYCFQENCGMIPFAVPKHPDQFYRLFVSLFLHAGVVHLAFTTLFQMYIMRDIEKLLGSVRIFIIYTVSGVAGNLASCIFVPYHVEAGPSGAQFGIAACLLVEVIQSLPMYKHPYLALLKVTLPLLCFFVLGLFPWFDNWAHIFGFLFGLLLAFSLMPYITFGYFDKHRKLLTIAIGLGSSVSLFVILLMVFYYAPISDCEWCSYISCIPITKYFCDNMAVRFNRTSTYIMWNEIPI